MQKVSNKCSQVRILEKKASIYLNSGESELAFLLGNSIAILLLQIYVFRIKNISQVKQFYYSILLSVFTFFIGTLSLKILVNFFSINVVISKIITLLETFLLNFFIRNIYFIRNSSKK